MNTTTNRPPVRLSLSAKDCAKMMMNPDPMADGWCNSATHTFSLYLLQERKAYECLVAVIKPNLPPNESVYRICRDVMRATYNAGEMEPMDGNESGSVNVREIVDHLAEELKET